MSDVQAISLTEVYKGWEVYQNHLLQATRPLTAEQLKPRAVPHLRSMGELIAHIIGCRASWYHYVMGEGGPEMKQMADWDQGRAGPFTAADLVHGLEVTWETMWTCLGRWTASSVDLEHLYTWEYEGETYTYTRQYIVWHVIEHDMHHGGELGYSLGMHHLAAPDL
jgi:uncharacterized damage-inducible protein DinB